MALSLYLDASVLVALLAPDPFSDRAAALLGAGQAPLIVSLLGTAEFSSAIARLVRMEAWTEAQARACFSDFDAWIDGVATQITIEPTDLRTASGFIRRLNLPLRAPDAIHIAIALRLSATLATFDRKMAAAAAALGVAVADA